MSLIIGVERTWCYVDPWPDEEKVLSDGLAFPVPGFRFMPQYRNGRWDGKRRFYHKGQRRFPTGLLPFVLRLLQESRANGAPIRPVKLRDARQIRERHDGKWIPWWSVPHNGDETRTQLRWYQQDATQSVFDSQVWGMPFPQGIVNSPTGSGKSLMAVSIYRRAGQPRTLYLVHRRLLQHQVMQTFGSDLGLGLSDIGQIGDGIVDYKPLIVGMIQTCHRLFEKHDPEFLEWLRGVDLLIVDEVHRVNDGQFFNVLQNTPASMRVGFSATPLRRGDLGDIVLLATIGPVIYRQQAAPLIAEGYLANPTVSILPDGSTTGGGREPYHVAYHGRIVHNQERNAAIVALTASGIAVGRRVLILVRSIGHGMQLLFELNEAHGILGTFLSGRDSKSTRISVLSKFRSGEIPVLIGSVILSEGIDIPELDMMIMASGGKSEIDVLQKLGRGMRPKADGSGLLVYDFADEGHKYLQRHALARVEAYKGAGYTVHQSTLTDAVARINSLLEESDGEHAGPATGSTGGMASTPS